MNVISNEPSQKSAAGQGDQEAGKDMLGKREEGLRGERKILPIGDDGEQQRENKGTGGVLSQRETVRQWSLERKFTTL